MIYNPVGGASCDRRGGYSCAWLQSSVQMSFGAAKKAEIATHCAPVGCRELPAHHLVLNSLSSCVYMAGTNLGLSKLSAFTQISLHNNPMTIIGPPIIPVTADVQSS